MSNFGLTLAEVEALQLWQVQILVEALAESSGDNTSKAEKRAGPGAVPVMR